ncbi:MAG: TRAP transporter substrate-binding protein DctP, partial [Chloroflexota bacterium]|nr:TRAP transporter substrate-binding protein DctP [Chloroflexota bacterium]
KMKRFRLSLILVLIVVLAAFVLTASAQEKTEVYKWKMISEEVQGDPMTVFAERFAELVEKKSNGRIEIEVYPYGTLGGERDIVELVQMGEIELGSVDYGWVGCFVPQVQVLALQYLWPRENTAEVMHDVCQNGQAIQLLEESFRNKGFQLLGAWCSGWMRVTSNVPISSPEDCHGLKHRVMASPILVKAYNTYGFNAQSLDYGEIYGALQTGLIDSQVQPMYAHLSMSFYEVQDYITTLWNEAFMVTPVVNREVFDSIPKDLQQILIDSCAELIVPMTNWSFRNNQLIGMKIREAKPTITICELSDEETAPFKELAWQEGGPVDSYLKIGGEGAQEILEALQADIEAAQK